MFILKKLKYDDYNYSFACQYIEQQTTNIKKTKTSKTTIYFCIQPFVFSLLDPVVHCRCHLYVPSIVRPFICSFDRPSIYMFLRSSIHVYVPTTVHPFICSSDRPSIYMFLRSSVHLYVPSIVRPPSFRPFHRLNSPRYKVSDLPICWVKLSKDL